jgi:cobalt-zinc-cadmium efflux system outer membrane protein
MKKYLISIIAIFGIYGQVNGQQINDLLYEAANNNPALKAQYYHYLAALERIEQQNTLPDPTISFGYFISPVETRVGPQNFKFSVAQMFPWMGTLKNKTSVAALAAQVEFEKFQELKNQLFYKVKMAHLDLYLLEQEIALNVQDINVLKSYEPITKTKYESNLVPLSDLVRVQIAIDHASSAIEVLEAKRTPLIAQINQLLNRDLDHEILVEDLPQTDFADTDLLDSALVNNPSIIKAKNQVALAESKTALTTKNRKPNIGVGFDYVFVGKLPDANIANNGRDILMPMVSLSLPIFSKRNKALEKESQLIRSSANHQLIAAENAIRNSWTEKKFLQEKARIEIDQLSREIEQTELLLSVLLSAYSNDNRNFEEVLGTQQKLLQLKMAVLESKYGQYKAANLQSFLTGLSINEFTNYEHQ